MRNFRATKETYQRLPNECQKRYLIQKQQDEIDLNNSFKEVEKAFKIKLHHDFDIMFNVRGNDFKSGLASLIK